MSIRRPRTVVGSLSWIMALCLAGCDSAHPPAPAEVKAPTERADVANEARGAAEAALGKQSEIVAQGDLALNGREQLLAVNRFAAGTAPGAGGANPSTIYVNRAAILEKSDGKWSEVLLCDEHLKNPSGYLGGSSAGRANGWRLEFKQDPGEGLEMKFTPAERFDAAHENADESSEPKAPTFDVRWNKIVKRYQTFDQSQERYLSEVPSLETPQSILK